MAPHRVSLSFQPLPGVFGCRGLRGGLLVRFLGFLYEFCTCRVGHLECAYFKLHISNFLSKFCNIDCLTLHPPRRSVSFSTNESERSRLGCHHPGVLFQQYAISGTRIKVAAQKDEFLPALQNSLDSIPTVGSCTGKVFSSFRHSALYSKRFQTINFAPKLLAHCVTESV